MFCGRTIFGRFAHASTDLHVLVEAIDDRRDVETLSGERITAVVSRELRTLDGQKCEYVSDDALYVRTKQGTVYVTRCRD